MGEYKEIITRYDLSNLQEKAYQQGAREFAEWLVASYIVSDVMGKRVLVEEIIAEWQKGEEE